MKHIYIIEHLDKKLYPWCIIEYKSISKLVGKKNVWFTNIKNGSKTLQQYGKVIKESVRNLNLKDACILDPDSPTTLSHKDSSKFKYLIFGGILGDYPPRKRTKEELTRFIPNTQTRNIGKEQLSTDNAVYVVKEILSGKSIKNIPFQDEAEIPLTKISSTILPYRYPVVNGKPRISEELLRHIKRKG